MIQVIKNIYNYFADGVIFPKTSGVGIKVDASNPVFGWKDLTGQLIPRASGGPAPVLGNLRGTGIQYYFYSANDVIDNCTFHITHDFLEGSDLHFHVHWSHNGTAISGNLVLNWYFQYCKGYNQAGQTYNAPLNVTQTIPITDINSHPRYGSFIEEFQLTNAGGDATHLDRNLIQTDALLIVGLVVTTIPTITGGTPNTPALITADVHYQSTQLATKNRNFPFYN